MYCVWNVTIVVPLVGAKVLAAAPPDRDTPTLDTRSTPTFPMSMRQTVTWG